MKYLTHKLYISLFVLFFIGGSISSAFAYSSADEATDHAIEYVRGQQSDDGQIDATISPWASMAFSAKHIDTSSVKKEHGTSLLDYLKNNPPTLESDTASWEKHILAIIASDQNPYSFGDVDFINNLIHYYDPCKTQFYLDSDRTPLNGNVSANVFGLLALLGSNVDPKNTIVTHTLQFLIDHQRSDGSYSYATNADAHSDIDDTAAALSALLVAKRQDVSNDTLDQAIEKAKTYITTRQNDDGGFYSDETPYGDWVDLESNTDSTSWAVIALSGYNNTFHTTELTPVITKAQTFLLSQQDTDNSFPYKKGIPGYIPQTLDTSYAIMALTDSIWPLKIYASKPPYNPTPIELVCQGPSITPTPTQAPTITPTPTQAPTVTPTPGSSASNTTNNQPTSTPTQAPTNTPKPTQTQSSTQTEDTISPTQTPEEEVLGAQQHPQTTKEPDQNINSWPLFWLFTLGGFGFLGVGIYYWKKN